MREITAMPMFTPETAIMFSRFDSLYQDSGYNNWRSPICCIKTQILIHNNICGGDQFKVPLSRLLQIFLEGKGSGEDLNRPE